MGQVGFIEFLSQLSGSYFTQLTTYSRTLLTLKKVYIAFGSILIAFQAAKIGMNIFNFGDHIINSPSWVKGMNIALNVFESLFFLGLTGVFIALIYYSWFLIFFIFMAEYGVAMVSNAFINFVFKRFYMNF